MKIKKFNENKNEDTMYVCYLIYDKNGYMVQPEEYDSYDKDNLESVVEYYLDLIEEYGENKYYIFKRIESETGLTESDPEIKNLIDKSKLERDSEKYNV